MARPRRPQREVPFGVRYSMALLEQTGVQVTEVHRIFGISPGSRARLGAKLRPEVVEQIRRELAEEDGRSS